MKLSDLTSRAGEWLRGNGPFSEVVISSRIRLARNVVGMPFVSRMSRQQRIALEKRIRDAVITSQAAQKIFYVDLEQTTEQDRQFLVERHLISKPHATNEGARGVAVSDDETVSIMVLEEDVGATAVAAIVLDLGALDDPSEESKLDWDRAYYIQLKAAAIEAQGHGDGG